MALDACQRLTAAVPPLTALASHSTADWHGEHGEHGEPLCTMAFCTKIAQKLISVF